MKLIDADALRARMYHDAFETDSDMQKWDGGCWIRYKMFENAIEDAPTIEPKKGKWIDCVTSAHWKCSECGDRAPMYWDANRQEYDEWYSAYCPNCGAKMEA